MKLDNLKIVTTILVVFISMQSHAINNNKSNNSLSVLTQKTILKENNVVDGEYYGRSISIDGDKALVSASSKGQDDLIVSVGKGAVFAYRKINDTWVLEDMLEASDAMNWDSFGNAISIDNDRVMIGAFRKNNLAGAVYVFEYNSTANQWIQVQKLIPNDTSQSNDFFGSSIILRGDTAFIGASLTNNAVSTSGSVYVYKLINGVWTQSQEMFANPEINYDYFGNYLAFSNGRLFVSSIGIAHDGAVHVFEENNGQWTHKDKITAPDSGTKDYFGSSLYAFGDRVFIGARNVEQAGIVNVGAVYIFDYDNNNSNWNMTTKILPQNPSENLFFSYSLLANGDNLYISALYTDDISPNSGTIFHYKLGVSSVTYKDKFKMKVPSNRSRFGSYMTSFNNELWISAPSSGSGAVIIYENDVIFTNSFE